MWHVMNHSSVPSDVPHWHAPLTLGLQSNTYVAVLVPVSLSAKRAFNPLSACEAPVLSDPAAYCIDLLSALLRTVQGPRPKFRGNVYTLGKENRGAKDPCQW
jgi:hypothetical protein